MLAESPSPRAPILSLVPVSIAGSFGRGLTGPIVWSFPLGLTGPWLLSGILGLIRRIDRIALILLSLLGLVHELRVGDSFPLEVRHCRTSSLAKIAVCCAVRVPWLARVVCLGMSTLCLARLLSGSAAAGALVHLRSASLVRPAIGLV